MEKKTLQEWCEIGDITKGQQKIIQKFGIEDKQPKYALNDLKKICFWNEKLKGVKDDISLKGKIKMMIFFSTWWNNNLVIVINEKSNDYWTSLIIYEPPLNKGRKEILEVKIFNVSDNYKWEETKNKAFEVEKILKSDNPILYNNPLLCFWEKNNYNFSEVIEQEFSLPLYSYSLGIFPEDYFKPLDIVKIYIKRRNREGKTINMLHSSIYLGNNKVCHARPHKRNNSKTDSYNSYGGVYYDFEEHYGRQGDEWGWVEITSFKNFLKFLDNLDFKAHKLVRFHSTIPYKNNQQIVKHIAKILDNALCYYIDRGNFDLEKNNCEHFVNLIKYGVDYSETLEVRKREVRLNEEFEFRNLEEEWKKGFSGKNDGLVDGITKDYFDPQIIKKIENYINFYQRNNQEIKMDARIEAVPPLHYKIGN